MLSLSGSPLFLWLEKLACQFIGTASCNFIIDENVVANVVVRVYPNKQKIEVTIPTKFAVLRAEVVQDDLYAAIDLANIVF